MCLFFLSLSLSFSFFLSFDTKQWHMFRRTYRHDVLHDTPVLLPKRTQPHTEHSWHCLTVISSTSPFPLLSSSVYFLFFSLSILSTSISILPSSHHVHFSEPLGIDDGGHMTKGAGPGHVCVSTALPDTMTRTHATWLWMLHKNIADISV